MQLDARRRGLLKRTFLDFQQTAEFIEHPLIFDRAEGVYHWDLDGRRYFDAIGGIFVAARARAPCGPPCDVASNREHDVRSPAARH